MSMASLGLGGLVLPSGDGEAKHQRFNFTGKTNKTKMMIRTGTESPIFLESEDSQSE